MDRGRRASAVGPVARRALRWPGHPPFASLAHAQVAHSAGDAMVAVALADTLFFSVPLGEARGQVALYLALTMAPFALLSPLVGPWLDRHTGSYRVAIVGAATGRAVLALLLANRTEGIGLFPLAFGLLVLSRVHGVSRSALVPDALPPGRPLIWANARLTILSSVSGALGAGVAVAVSRGIGTETALFLTAAVFAVGAWGARHVPLGTRTASTDTTSFAADFRLLLGRRLLGGGLLMATTRVAVGFTIFFLAFVLRRTGEGGAALALVAGAAGAGLFVAAVVAPPLRRVVPELVVLAGAAATTALVSAWAALDYSLARAAVLAAVVGAASGIGRLAFDSLLQTDAPQTVRGRTFARYETIFQFAWVGGAAVALVPLSPAPGLWTLAVISVTGLVLGIRSLRHPARPRPPLP